MRKLIYFFIISIVCGFSAFGQYTMSNQTVTACEGTLTDSEANTVNPGYYTHNENYSFTICPPNAVSITITFTSFETELNNDYVRIFDGADTNSPLIGGPFSGANLPPVVVSNGCITINFISDVNVAAEGFTLNWIANVLPPSAPNVSLPNSPTCSTNVLSFMLDQNIHCDSVSTAIINLGGQLNQTVVPTPINCVNDSTNTIQLNLSPGLNQSGVYNLYFETYYKDPCDSIWVLSSTINFVINDCPLQVDLMTNSDTICIGESTDLFVQVDGGDSNSYNYNWSPFLPSSFGPHSVSPLVTTTYYITVSDAGPAQSQTDSITIYVLPLPIPQNDTTVCRTGPDFNLNATPAGGWWWGFGIVNGGQGIFSPTTTGAGTHTVTYGYAGCSETMDITVLPVEAGPDIAVCPNAPTFNLNTSATTPGGIWSGCNCLLANGDITVGAFPSTFGAIYTLPNGCLDTLEVVVQDIVTQADDTLCQKEANYTLTFSPPNGYWTTPPTLPLQSSSCANAIATFPFSDPFETGLTNWTNDPLNDFNWTVNSGGTPSSGTGPTAAFEGVNYIYTEASNGNFPYKRAGIISQCLNLSQYSNPILHFWYHMYDNPGTGPQPGQGTFSVDISIDNGTTWINDIWLRNGNQGNQWIETAIDLSNYNTSTEVYIRLRVVTGIHWQSDVAVDMLSILGGPITPNGVFLPIVADSGNHTLIYNIQGCSDTVNLYLKPIDAGNDMDVCPTSNPFNLAGMPAGGLWTGTHITNPISGLFNPALGLGVDAITYTFDGCTDTAFISVQSTDVVLDSIFACNDGVIITLDSMFVSRSPTYGSWSGNGIVSATYPGEFDPTIAGMGSHTIYYTANSCADSIVFDVAPASTLTDTIICSTAADFFLSANPAGGQWAGQGIVNNNTGLFSPTTAGVGVHDIYYQSPIGCMDTTTITVYNNPLLSMSGLVDNYCYLDTLVPVNVNPIGGILSGNGINNLTFNPALAGPGYHIITYTYGSGTCMIDIDTLVLVGDSLKLNTYATKDSLCFGETISIGANISGGIGNNYSFSWDNSLGNSFDHLVSPTTSTNYNVVVTDGCSEQAIGSIDIFVYPTFSLSFNTSTKDCYGELGFAKVNVTGNSNYTYQWNTNPAQTTDSINAAVARNYRVTVTDNASNCSISDTISIPGYEDIFASFFINKEECISILDGSFQFIDNSNVNISEISPASFWSFGDSSSAPYVFGNNPEHNYTDTGNYMVNLVLINNGNCTDTASLMVCVYPDNKIFVPNSFTPNLDHCNDEFFVKGVGGFYQFNIKIHKRWGGDMVFESNEIVLTNSYADGNLCNIQQELYAYYKMGTWDGLLENGAEAPMGVYAFVIEYKQLADSPVEKIVGTVTLIR